MARCPQLLGMSRREGFTGARPAEEAGSLTGPGSRKKTRAESTGERGQTGFVSRSLGNPRT